MSEQIDHAAEAVRLLSMGPHVIRVGESRTDSAQVHATLAVAEQLRIANLITLGKYVRLPDDWPTKRVLFYAPISDPDDPVAAEIREALGLS